jgi:hypothetical protein
MIEITAIMIDNWRLVGGPASPRPVRVDENRLARPGRRRTVAGMVRFVVVRRVRRRVSLGMVSAQC